MIEENKSKEATSVNNSMSVPNPESLPSTSGHNTSQGPLYENLAKTSGPVYQNLEEVKNDKGDNQSFRAEVMYDKDVSTSSIGLLSNVSLEWIISIFENANKLIAIGGFIDLVHDSIF